MLDQTKLLRVPLWIHKQRDTYNNFYKSFNGVINIETAAHLSIKLACLSVRLYPINVKTAEPIGPKFCVGPHVTPGKVYEWSKF